MRQRKDSGIRGNGPAQTTRRGYRPRTRGHPLADPRLRRLGSEGPSCSGTSAQPDRGDGGSPSSPRGGWHVPDHGPVLPPRRGLRGPDPRTLLHGAHVRLLFPGEPLELLLRRAVQGGGDEVWLDGHPRLAHRSPRPPSPPGAPAPGPPEQEVHPQLRPWEDVTLGWLLGDLSRTRKCLPEISCERGLGSSSFGAASSQTSLLVG